MSFVTTVLGNLEIEQLGYCQPHEHVYITETPALLIHEELRINNLAASIEELKLYKAAGGTSLVDANPIATGRDARALADASKISGVNIVASTGYHIPIFYDQNHWIWKTNRDALIRLFVEELTKGMYLGGSYGWPTYRTDIKAGLVKAALIKGCLEKENNLFLAAGYAAIEAGTSIMIHTEYGRDAVKAIKILEEIGLAPERVLIAHADRQTEEFSIHEAIAQTGAFLEYDTLTMFEIHDNESEIELIQHMILSGYKNQILLSTDPTADRMKSYSGQVGIDYIHRTFIPALRKSGISKEDIEQIMRSNPARALERI